MRVDDYIKVGDSWGTVVDIGLRVTRIVTRDEILIIIHVLATLSRMVIEVVWRKGEYGERACTLDEVYHEREARSWKLAEHAISGVLRQQPRLLIDDWRAHHPHVEAVPYTHFSEFARSIEQSDKPLDMSLLPLLCLDPLRSRPSGA